jgi:bifunctional DNase/RNase
MEGFDKMVIHGVSFDVASRQPIVLLKSEQSDRYLPIWIGSPHDLLTNVLGCLSAKLERVLVTELKDNTFYAVLRVTTDGRQIDIDSRPSDAIALAVRTEAPIFASHELLEVNGIELDQEPEQVDDVMAEFRDFLDQVSPEDF